MKIAFIGGGVMGEVMLSAILDKGLTTPQAIWVSDIKETRRQHLEQGYGVATMSNNQLVAEKSEVVVLSIKPQNLAEVMAEIKLKPTQLVLPTLLGSGHLIQKSGKPPAELQGMVTTPGGVTAEALLQLEKGGFTGLVIEAVIAAHEKAKRLGN